MKEEKLQKILNEISFVKIAVVGDFCLDTYWFVDETMSEISVETNKATRPVAKQRYSLGGAGNVANNLAAMGVRDVRAFGVIGADPFGNEMVRIMMEAGINPQNIMIQEQDWSTHTYIKPYINDDELNRIDFGNFNHLSEKSADLLIENLIKVIADVDIVIINQQVPSGIHTEYFKKLLVEVILHYPQKQFIADSRDYNDFYDGSIRKMNDKEAVRLCGINKKPDEIVNYSEIVTSASELFKRYQKPVFITRGDKGSITVDEAGISEIPGLMILAKVDTVGAGDSYLAGLASALAAGYSIVEAAKLGTFTAGVTVQKLFQTGTATPAEIISIGRDPDYIYSPELAENVRYANYLDNTEIEIVKRWEHKPEIEYAIFDHDGTISTLREGWELIMAPVMIKAILGNKCNCAGESLFSEVSVRVNEFIDKTTGIQTLAQMTGLINLIREFDCVPEDKILDPAGYKQIFNDELLKLVAERQKKLKAGELSVEDFTIKNAVPFLRKLFDSGVKLYLASGTDIEDVISEVRFLGYEQMFEGRIFGAVGDMKKEAKRIVLDNILAKKKGGLTIGVASNELRRYGKNEHKRTRLIKAGADIIIPDFSQINHLLKLLNI